MSIQWYYLHAAVTHGPLSEEEINAVIARRLLLASDLVWPEGRERKDAAPASVVFDFAPLPAASSPIPDWLADVAVAEDKMPSPEPLLRDEPPKWLDDLRLWVGLDAFGPFLPSFGSTLATADRAGKVPDWLQSWLTPEKPKNSPTLPSLVPIAAATPTPSCLVPTTLAAQPQALLKTEPIAAAAPSLTFGPAIDSSPAEIATSSHKTPNFLVQKMLQASGFDLETGQILDPAKFAKWKQQQAQMRSASEPAVSNASLFEVFRKGRIAVETWVDDDKNRQCILQAGAEEIKSSPEVQAILQPFANYGKELQEKLLRHLQFMVENRRKYYNAMTGRPN
jgi:hypothetical protein